MSSYPPNPNRFDDFVKLLELLKSVVPDRSAIYVSAPITSGRRLADWHRRSNGSLPQSSHPDYDELHAKEVIQPNREHAAAVIASLRAQYQTAYLIDPTAMGDLDGWTQHDYRYFWGEVIKQYVVKVVFIDGWHFSAGCAYEFLIAQRESIETVDEQSRALAAEDGVRLLHEAVNALGQATDSGEFIRGVLRDLAHCKDGIYA